MNARILVIGGNHHSPLGVIESLGRQGFTTDAIIVCNAKSSFVLKSKYIDKGYHFQNFDNVFELLKRNYNIPEEKVIVITCSDDGAAFIDDNKERLPNNFILPGVGADKELRELVRKDKQIELAQSLGMNVPLTSTISPISTLTGIEYPCVTKSITSVGHGKTECSICNSAADLKQFLAKLPADEQIQVQKLIDSEYEFQFLGCSLDSGKTIIIPGYTYIEKAFDFTNATFLKYQKVPDNERFRNLITKTNEFIKANGYTGLFSVEFMHGKDGKDYFLEMNFRNDGNGISVTAGGTNLPYIYYLWATGADYKSEIQKSSVNMVYCVPEDTYFISMLKGNIPFKKWRSDMRKVNCHRAYFKGNTAPFWSLLWLQKKPIAAIFAKRILSLFRKRGHGNV